MWLIVTEASAIIYQQDQTEINRLVVLMLPHALSHYSLGILLHWISSFQGIFWNANFGIFFTSHLTMMPCNKQQCILTTCYLFLYFHPKFQESLNGCYQSHFFSHLPILEIFLQIFFFFNIYECLDAIFQTEINTSNPSHMSIYTRANNRICPEVTNDSTYIWYGEREKYWISIPCLQDTK